MPEVNTQTKTKLDFTQSEKRAALIIASKDFRDEEYFVPREVLEKAGIEVITVSDSKGKAKGADGGEVEVDLTLSDLEVGDFNLIVFVGGPGTLEHLDNEDSYKVIRKTLDKGKILGAICIAPVILARAGALRNKEVTVWSSSMDKEPVEIVKGEGANYHDRSVVIDDNIVTADGPESARKFGEALLHALTRK
ncbi:MAG: DJ-1/PfpI family protein [Candidatus Paceibacterota bacterium]